MMRVGSIGSVGRLSGRWVAWTHAALFAAGQQGGWFDPSDISTLFQDVAGTIPVTAPGQAVALIRDKSGRGNHASQATPGSRPLYALHPSSGIRNVANGAASVGDTTYWPAAFTHNGITITKVAAGIDTDGLPYIDYSVVGTAAGSSFIPTYGTGYSRTTASSGQQWVASAIVRVVSGPVPPANCGFRFEIYGETAPSTQTETYSAFTVVAPSTETPVVASATLTNPATNQTRCGVVIRTQDGATVNYTVRIKGLQFERGSGRTAYQANYSATNIVEAPFAQIGNLLFDGNGFLVTPAIDFSGTDEVTVIARIRKESDAARGIVVELGPLALSASFLLDAPGIDPATQKYRFVSVGSTVGVAETTIGAAPDTAVLTGIGKISTDTAILRRNGVQIAASSGDQGTGNFANAVVYIGRRGGTTLPFRGRLYGLTFINRVLTAEELARAEA